MSSIWKPIKGFEGIYEVSTEGQIRSLARVVVHNDGRIRKLKGKFLKYYSNNGYMHVYLSRNGTQKSYPVHRIVAGTFIDNPDNKPEVNHKNGCKSDNTVDNLEWVTHKENIDHAFSNGYMCGGTHEHMCRISKLGNKVSCAKSSLPVLCETDGRAFKSMNAADRYYGYYPGSVRTALHKASRTFRNNKFRLLSKEESEYYTLLS